MYRLVGWGGLNPALQFMLFFKNLIQSSVTERWWVWKSLNSAIKNQSFALAPSFRLIYWFIYNNFTSSVELISPKLAFNGSKKHIGFIIEFLLLFSLYNKLVFLSSFFIQSFIFEHTHAHSNVPHMRKSR